MIIDLDDVKTWDAQRCASVRFLLPRAGAMDNAAYRRVMKALTDRLKELGVEK